MSGVWAEEDAVLGNRERIMAAVVSTALATPCLAACGGASQTVPKSPPPPHPGPSTCAALHLGDDLELVVLGSGGPRSAGRAAASYLVAVDGVPLLLIDARPGSFVRLGESGLPAAIYQHDDGA